MIGAVFRAIAVWTFALVTLAAAQPQPPRRPVEDVRLLLARFNNGSDGFAASDLAKKAIGFAQTARDGEFALAYFEDRGDNTIHLPLYLAIGVRGKPWLRKAISSPTDRIGAVGGLFLGKDYLLVATRAIDSPAAQHMLAFTRDLVLKHAVAGGPDLDPLPKGTVVFHPNSDRTAPAVRSETWLFDIETGASRLLYPLARQSQPSVEYKERLPELVRRLNEVVPKGNYGRGYRPEWYSAVKVERPLYDPQKDRLLIDQVIAPTWPIPPAPGLQIAVEVIPVTCGPMLAANPRCTEGTRTISAWPRPR